MSGSTWIVGDIHGCAEELAALAEQVDFAGGDRLLSVGDLWHRGPDPAGVMDVMRERGIRFILGNHERRVLQRFRLAPERADGADRPPLQESFGTLEPEDLAGDGGRVLNAPPERFGEMLTFLQGHDGYFLEHTMIEGAGPTRDGRPWCMVHAGIWPGQPPAQSEPEQLCALRRLPLRGQPYWYEVYTGPNLILFGHTPSNMVRQRRVQGRLVAVGLDTGCAYGGELTAYSPELDAWLSVPCKKPGGYCRP